MDGFDDGVTVKTGNYVATAVDFTARRIMANRLQKLHLDLQTCYQYDFEWSPAPN